MSDMIEIWKPVVGWEDRYMVSNLGRVKSLFLNNERVLKNVIGSNGYSYITLSANNERCIKTIHRLVCEAFLPNPENKPCIDHVNTIRSDNRVIINKDGSIDYDKSNLRWCTYSENRNNPLTLKKISGDNNPKSMLGKYGKENHLSKPIIQFTLEGELVRKWDCIADVERQLNICHANILKVINGERKTAGGSIWEYYNTDRYLIALMIKTLKERERAA